jgi:NADH-quinone oxidoreductase subunit I
MNIVRRTLDGIYNLLLGMWTTVKYLFSHAITLQYPDERWNMPQRSRGVVALMTDPETGKLKCIACSMCVKTCPTAAINMVPETDETGKKKRYPKEFEVDEGLCIFCGLCEEVCPVKDKAIKLVNLYEFSVYSKKELVYHMEKLTQIGKGYK